MPETTHGRIIATVEDYAVVRELVADVMTEGVGGTVSNTVRETVEAVVVLVSQIMFEERLDDRRSPSISRSTSPTPVVA